MNDSPQRAPRRTQRVPDTRNRAFMSAWKKGRASRRRGRPMSDNPYRDHRTDSGKITFSRVFIRYWNRGWKYEDEEMRLIEATRRRIAEGISDRTPETDAP